MYPPELKYTMNPCGMVMDWLVGYGYQQQTVGFADGRSIVLRWAPAHRYAVPFPRPWAFYSTSNDPSCEDYRGVGTAVGGKIWQQDEYLPYVGDGTFCGQLDWFEYGLPADPPTGFDPCSRCVIQAGGPMVDTSVDGAAVGEDLVVLEAGGAAVIGILPDVQLVQDGANAGGADVALEVGGLVGTGAYSTAYGSAWDAYRFE